MSEVSLVERLLSAYKQAFLYLVVSWVYSIIGFIVILIGIGIAMSSTSDAVIIVGMIIVAFGYILLIVSGLAAFLFTATRGVMSTNPIGFMEAYTVTFKLLLELAIAVVVAILFIILGVLLAKASAFLAFLFFTIGGIIAMLFPIAALFYVIEYLKTR